MKWSKDKIKVWVLIILALVLFGLILTVYNIFPVTYMTIMGLINLAILIYVIWKFADFQEYTKELSDSILTITYTNIDI